MDTDPLATTWCPAQPAGFVGVGEGLWRQAPTGPGSQQEGPGGCQLTPNVFSEGLREHEVQVDPQK